MIQALIFDLDGVLVDTARFHSIAWKRVADIYDIPFDENRNETLKGISRIDSLDKILAWGDIQLTQEEKMKLLVDKNKWYLDLVAEMPENDVLPGTYQFLDWAKAAGYKIALGSVSKNARMITDKVGLTHYFDVYIDGTKVTKTKPDPQTFTLGADGLHVPYKNCVVFEDSRAGIEGATTAGMYTIGIGKKENLPQAQHVFESLDKIPTTHFNQLFSKQ